MIVKNWIPIIDAGHGGIINGQYQTKGKKQYTFTNHNDFTIYEGQINRLIAQKVIFNLSAKSIPCYSPFVYNQEDIRLSERVSKYNILAKENKKLNLYGLSIHSNAASKEIKGAGTKANGFEVHTSPGEDISDVIAVPFGENYISKFPGRNYRKIYSDQIDKDSPFYILTKSNFPFVLVENLFYDNYEEATYLSSDSGQNEIADSLTEVIADLYYNGIEIN